MNEMKDDILKLEDGEVRVFGEIALSLSGGGYRAAAFHLGVLDLLDRLGVLKDVGAISTVSGGSIVGVFYAVSTAERRTFDEFYSQFYRFLLSRNVISEAFEFVSEKKGGQPLRSLIKAAAKVYSSPDFLGDRRFGLLLDSTRSHLSEQVFNATDFLHGVSFRFVKSTSRRALIGNSYSSMPRSIARECRLADIVAASSCFPSVFEPFAFPDDFKWDLPLEEIRKGLGVGFEKPIALMDGGIFDNQGIDSIMQVYRRKGKKLGLFVVSDVGDLANTLYQLESPARKGLISLGTLVLLSWLLFGFGVVSLLWLMASGYLAYSRGEIFVAETLLVFGIPSLFTAVALAALYSVRSKFNQLDALAERTAGVNLWGFLKQLTIPELITFSRSRITSLISLSSTIFMKRVRDLTFYNLFTHPKYRERILPVLIYDLSAPQSENGEREEDDEKTGEQQARPDPRECSEELLEAIEDARSYKTNLWFFDEQKLINLINSGQATTCRNLQKFLEEHHGDELNNSDSGAARLHKLATEFWMEINRDPKAVLRQRFPVGSEE